MNGYTGQAHAELNGKWRLECDRVKRVNRPRPFGDNPNSFHVCVDPTTSILVDHERYCDRSCVCNLRREAASHLRNSSFSSATSLVN